MASMVAPLVSIPFIHYQKAEWLIWCSCAIEVTMLLLCGRQCREKNATSVLPLSASHNLKK
ncbi:transporter permease [Actinobacillus equuli]|nr:transporter permease [Actinobacillus equuli]